MSFLFVFKKFVSVHFVAGINSGDGRIVKFELEFAVGFNLISCFRFHIICK